MTILGLLSDPFTLKNYAYIWGNKNTDGRTVHDPRIVAGEKTAVFIVHGQSLAGGFGGSQYTVSHSAKVDEINIFDGGCYAYADPLLGGDFLINGNANGGSNWGRLGDKLIDAGWCNRCIFIPCGVAGTMVSQWQPTANLYYQRLDVACRRTAALGLPVTALLCQIGETDGANGTSQSAWTSSMMSIIGGMRSEGFAAPWLVAKSTHYQGVASDTIRSAQAAVTNGVDILSGPDIDTLGDNNRYDQTHMNGTGLDASAELWKERIISALHIC